MGKKKDMTTDELRDYLLEQIKTYDKMIKELRAKAKEADNHLKEARLLVEDIKKKRGELE